MSTEDLSRWGGLFPNTAAWDMASRFLRNSNTVLESAVFPAGSVIAIISALIVIAVLVFYAYKFYQKRKRSKEESTFEEESSSYAGHNQAPYLATGVPVSEVPPMG